MTTKMELKEIISDPSFITKTNVKNVLHYTINRGEFTDEYISHIKTMYDFDLSIPDNASFFASLFLVYQLYMCYHCGVFDEL